MWKAYAAQRAAQKLKKKNEIEEKAVKILQVNYRAYMKRKKRLEEIKKIAEEKAKADAERAAKQAQEEANQIELEKIKTQEEQDMQKAMGCCLPFRRR